MQILFCRITFSSLKTSIYHLYFLNRNWQTQPPKPLPIRPEMLDNWSEVKKPHSKYGLAFRIKSLRKPHFSLYDNILQSTECVKSSQYQFWLTMAYF